MLNNIKKLFDNKIIKAGSWYTITNFFIKGITFLTIPIFTRLLTTAEYGFTSIYTSWVGIFSIFISFNLYSTVGRAKIDFKEEYDEFNSSVMFFSLITFFLYLSIFILFESFFLSMTGLPKILFYLMVFQSYLFFLQEYIINKFRFDYNYKAVSIVNIFLTGLGVLFSIFLIVMVFQDDRVFGKILGQILPLIVMGLFTLIYFISKGKTLVNFKYWKYALILGVPLVFHALANVINSQFDRILINRYLGPSEAGIYSFSYNIGIIIQVLSTSFNQAWVPWFYEKMETRNLKTIRSYAGMYRDVFTVAYAVVLLISPELIKIMGDKNYWAGISIMPWIMMAYYFQFMYSFEFQIEIVHKKTYLISAASILSAIINITLNIIFIPKYGYTAAAITTVVSYFFLFLFHYFMASKVIKDNVFGMKFHLVSLGYVSGLTLFFFISKEIMLIRFLGVLSIVVAFVYRFIKNKKMNLFK